MPALFQPNCFIYLLRAHDRKMVYQLFYLSFLENFRLYKMQEIFYYLPFIVK